MGEVSGLLRAIAALLWPVLAFVALWMFRADVRQALTRLRKGKIFGQEFELEQELQRLEQTAAAAEKEADALPSPEPVTDVARPDAAEDEAEIQEILKQASNSPKIALMMLSATLDRQARQSLAIRGLLKNRSNISAHQALRELTIYGFPSNITESFQIFREVRNRIVHGGSSSDDDILRAVDSGITILRLLKALPNEINIIYHPGTEIYEDANGVSPIVDTKGVILETRSPSGVLKNFRIFPTTRTHFKKGKQVAWEWSIDRVWGPAWYRDPDDQKIKHAWDASMEFIGRHLDDI